MTVLQSIWTLITFSLACCFIPIWFISYIFVQCSRAAYTYALSVWYRRRKPQLDFVRSASVRNSVETRRNQGVITWLVAVRGVYQPDLVRKHLRELIEHRDKFGYSSYPRLKQTLVSLWGCYAWDKNCRFQLEQHLIVGSNMFRGRLLSQNNIQEYVSEIVAKYLPNDIPPWQIVVIPNPVDNKDTHYLLVRVHHLLLSEEKHLNVSDFLMIKRVSKTFMATSHFDQLEQKNLQLTRSPLLDIFEPPSALPELYGKLTEHFSNRCNEFISKYDPLENPEILKHPISIFNFFAILLITAMSSLREYRRGFCNISADPDSRIKYLMSTIEREATRRQITFYLYFNSILHSLDPRYVIKTAMKIIWHSCIFVFLKAPMMCYYEIRAFHDCLMFANCSYPNTFIGLIYLYIPIYFKSFQECVYCVKIVMEAPKQFLHEFMMSKFGEKPQKIPLCGRKVVSWSKKIQSAQIRAIANKINSNETSILLGVVGAALREFYQNADVTVPDDIAIVARNISKKYLYSADVSPIEKKDFMGGIVCLKIPTVPLGKDERLQENIKMIENSVNSARQKQQFTYLLSKFQTKHDIITKSMPSVATRIILNYLSRRYTVSLTEMMASGDKEEDKIKTTVWGQEIDNVIYWRPPQSNISLSLCLISYGDHISLGVMTDALLSPHQLKLSEAFELYIAKLAEETGVPTSITSAGSSSM